MKYEKLVKDILSNIGGKENISSVTHCITRLRFKLKDEKKANTETIKNLPGVVTVMISGGQYQVVIGNHVPDVYKEFLEVAGIQGESEEEDSSAPKGNILDRFIDIISGVFQPLLGILSATGMIKGLVGILTATGLVSMTSGTYQVLNAVGDCLFYFFPIFLGFTAAKKFRLNQFYGMAIGAAMVYPQISAFAGGEIVRMLFEGTIFQSAVQGTFLGLPLIIPQQGYASTVIPVIVAVACAAPLERFLRKIIPDVVKTFIVPFFTLLIIIPVTFLVIGPITTILSSMLGNAILSVYNLSPALMGLIVGGFWQILVIFGLHWGIIPLMINNLMTIGFDTIVITSFAASFAQTGVVIAIFLKTKNIKLKSLTIPSIISGFFGVTEPAIYGITLPRKRTFVVSCIIGALGGAVLGFNNAKAFMMGGLGVFAYPAYRNILDGESYILLAIIVSIAAVILGIIGGYLVYDPKVDGTGEESSDALPTSGSASIGTKNDEGITSPIKGTVVPLSEISDAAFASGAIGKGAAIIPEEGKLYAPFSGTVTTLFPTLHAIGLTSDEGIELLIHVGMDTVQLEGKHFTAHVAQGDKVTKGQLLEEFDIQGIEKDGYSAVTPVVITNYADYLDIIEPDKKSVTTQDVLIYVIKN